MKIIFSRKGFDSSAGGFPSIILPDGSLFSIPIPSSSNHCDYSRLSFSYKGEAIQEILNQICNKRLRLHKQWRDCDFAQPKLGCHHDPMFISETNQLALGQTENSESHLRNQEIKTGDIFLFYGWFKNILRINDHWRYAPNAKDVHVIWSWMTVDQIIPLDTVNQIQAAKSTFPQLLAHPHLSDDWNVPNTIYLSKENALLRYSDINCLTNMNNYVGRSTWRLPVCFNQPQAFSYLKLFNPENSDVVIKYRGYGQEFVLDLEKVLLESDRQAILRYVDKIRAS